MISLHNAKTGIRVNPAVVAEIVRMCQPIVLSDIMSRMGNQAQPYPYVRDHFWLYVYASVSEQALSWTCRFASFYILYGTDTLRQFQGIVI